MPTIQESLRMLFYFSTLSLILFYDSCLAIAIGEVTTTTDSITVTWSEQPNVTSYNVACTEIPTSSVTSDEGVPCCNHTVIKLKSGVTYNCSIIGGTENGNFVITTRPLKPSSVWIDSQGTHTLSVGWILDCSNSNQDEVHIDYSNKNITVKNDICKGPKQIEDLHPGVLYNISFYVSSFGEKSDKYDLSSHTKPLPPSQSGITVTDVTNTSAIINWIEPSGTNFDDYKISISTTNSPQTVQKAEVKKAGPNMIYPLDNLVPGSRYEVGIATQINGTSSDESKISFYTRPNTPTLVNIETGVKQLTINWRSFVDEPVDSWKISLNSETRTIDRREDEQGDVTIKYEFKELSPGNRYNMSLVSIKNEKESLPFSATYFTKSFPPSEPFVATDITYISLTLSWAKPLEGVFDSYYLNNTSSIEGGTWPEILKKEQFTVNGLKPGKQYTFELWTAAVAEDSSTFSTKLTMKAITIPNPPVNIVISGVTEESVEISWTGPNVGDPSLEYILSWMSVDDGPVKGRLETATTTATSYKIEKLLSGHNYSLEIISNVAGTKSPPLETSFITKPRGPGLSITSYSNDEITCQLARPDGFLSEYEISIIPNTDGFPKTVNSSTTELNIKSLFGGTLYNIIVISISHQVKSEPSSIEQLTKPNEPRFIDGQVSETSVVLNWTKPAGNVENYEISYNGKTIKTNQTTLKVEKLSPGVTYIFSLQSTFESETSSSVNRSITTKPSSVKNVIQTISSTEILLTWETNESSVQDKYEVIYRPVLKNISHAWIKTTVTSKEFNILYTAGEKYEIEIFAVSVQTKSDVAIVPAIQIEPLGPESLKLINRTENKLEISWTQPEGYFQYYELNYELNVASVERIERSTTSHEISVVSGTTYNISLRTVSGISSSPYIHITETSMPQCTATLREETTSPTALSIKYTDDSSTSHKFDSYNFTLTDRSGQKIEQRVKKKSDNSGFLHFTNVIAGMLYTVAIETVAEGVTSKAKQITVIANPNDIVIDPKSEVFKNEIRFTWEAPAGIVQYYAIKCVSYEEQNVTETRATFTGLQTFKEYSFFFVAGSYGKESLKPKFIKKFTGEDKPSKVRNLQVVDFKPYEVTLSWLPPYPSNGILRSYTVHYYGGSGGKSVTDKITFDHSGGQGNTQKQLNIIPNLLAGYTYSFTVYASNDVGDGPTDSVNQILPIRKPDLIVEPNKAKPGKSVTSVSQTSVSVTLYKAFSDRNGPILGYDVIVKGKNYIPVQSRDPQSYFEVKDQDVWPPYFAVKYCDIFAKTNLCQNGGNPNLQTKRKKRDVLQSVDLEIGTQVCKTGIQQCNGPLKANTEYEVKLRAYTSAGYSDTPYSEPIKTEAETHDPTGIIVGVIIAVAILVVVPVAVGVVFYLRYKRRKKDGSENGGVFTRNCDAPIPVTVKSRPVELSDFENHYKFMSADSDFRFAEEYEELTTVGRDQTNDVSQMQSNRMKNRFTNILPFDWSRVKLCPIEDYDGEPNDYINANYMPGFTSKREFIVTQGPLPSTIDDFWRMVWEQNSRAIVMVTQLVENGRERCEQYWPRYSDPVYYGDVEVTILSETKYNDFTVMNLMLKKDGYKRNLTHFYYRVWPDHGVPTDSSTLLTFIREIRSKLQPGGPILVHCSAGVGRSGTYIALDRLLQHMERNDFLDVYGVVYEMRKHRRFMVQTEQQYVFIHKCLVDVIQGKESAELPEPEGENNTGFEGDYGIQYYNGRPFLKLWQYDEGITLEMMS